MGNSDSSFQQVLKDKVIKTIKKLDPKKVVQLNDIPTKLIKSLGGFFSDYIYINLNKCIKDGEYVEDLKSGSASPVQKRW